MKTKNHFPRILINFTWLIGFPLVPMNRVSAYVDSSLASIKAGAVYHGMEERVGMAALVQFQATFPRLAGLKSNDS